MKRTVLSLALLALILVPAMAKKGSDKGNDDTDVGQFDDKRKGKGKGNKGNDDLFKGTNKPSDKKDSKPPKVCLEAEGWIELDDDVTEDAPELMMLELNAEQEGKAVAIAAGCVHRKTVLQKACSKPGPIPPGLTLFQYRAKEQMRCPGSKKTRNVYFARDYTPPVPSP